MRRSELHDLQANYECYIKLTVSPTTSVRYGKALEAFFSRFRDKLHPEEITRRDAEDYRVIRLEEGLSARTINYELAVVRTFYNWLMQMERITWNPISQVKRLKEIESPKTSLNRSEQLALQKGCFCWGDRALTGLALTTGLRGETLASLEKSEINFEQRCLTIPAEKMKARRVHEIPLPTWVLEILSEAPEGRIFENYAKNANSLRYRWNRICARAGIQQRGIRLARRTFATTLLRAGTDLKIVQDLLGHRNILTTSRYLTTADNATTRAAIDKLPVPEEYAPTIA